MGSYYDSIKGAGPPTAWDIENQAKSNKVKPPLSAVVRNAAQDVMSPYAISRIFERDSSQYDKMVDSDWKVDDKVQADLDRNYDTKDTKYIMEARSEPEFIARKRYVQEDITRKNIIASAGGAGIIASVGMSLLDPVAIAAGAFSGGVLQGAKLTGLTRIATIGAASGIENAAIEAVLSESNTQSSPYDIILALGTGAVLGAGIGAITKGPKLEATIDHAANTITEEAANVTAFDLAKKAQRLQPRVDTIDTRAVTKAVDDHIESLTRETEGFLTSGQLGQVDKQIAKATKELDETDVLLREAQGSETVQREAFLKKETEFAETVEPKVKEIEATYSKRIKEAEDNIKKIERKPDTQKREGKLFVAEDKLSRLKKAQADEIKAVRSKAKASVSKVKSKFKSSLDQRIGVVKAQRKVITNRITELEGIKSKAEIAKKSKTDLNKFNNLSDEAKATALFGKGKIPLKQVELKRQINAGKEISPKPDVEPKVSEGTVGAEFAGFKPYVIKAEDNIDRFAHDGANMPEDLRGKRILPKFTKHIQSIQTRLSNSDNMAIRGFAYHLFEAPQGGAAAEITAAARVHNNNTIIRSVMRNRLNEGLEEWGANQGISLYKTLMRRENFNSYHKKVILEVKYPGTFTDTGIVKGAEGVRAQLKEAGRIRKDAGEAGFDNIDLDANYAPTVINEGLVKSATLKHGEAKVISVLSKSYQEGKHLLKPELADRIAEGYVKRSLNNTLTMKDVIAESTNKDVDSMIKGLQEAGVDEDVIQDYLDTTMQKEINSQLSDRAKFSLFPDLRTEFNGLKMVDLIESDLPRLLESYTRSASGGAAFAKLGFSTRGQVMGFLTDLEKQSNNLGLNQTNIAEEIQVLRDGVDLLYGRSVNKDAHSPFVRNLGRLRDLTSFLRLQSVGIASIPEGARITANRGLKNVIENVPDLGIGIKGTKNLREGGKYSGQFKRTDLRELEEVMGYVGEDHVLYPNGLRVDNLEEAGFDKSLGAMMDNALAQGKRIQEITSAFRLVQGTGEKLAARSLGGQIKKWVDGAGDALSEANIKDAGWFEDDFLDDLKVWMTKNKATDIHNGKDIRLFNFGKMPAEMQERLQVGMHRLVRRDMQRPFIGEAPVMMHKWLGQTLTQFRSFSLLSLEKQLIHDIRHDRIAGATIALHSAFLGFLGLTINTLNRGIGREDADEFIKNNLTGTNAVLGVFNRMGQTASVGIGLDFLATLGALPEEISAPGHTGYRGLSSSSIPLVGLASDVKDVGVDLVDILKGDGAAGRTIRDIQQVVPFAKTVGINQAFNAIER